MKLPLNGRAPHLGEPLLLEPLSRRHNQLLLLPSCLTGMGFGPSALFLVPCKVTRLIPLEPLEKPFLRPLQLRIYLLWRHTVEVFHYCALPDLLLHALNLLRYDRKKVIIQNRPSGNRCIDTKSGIKGNLCIDTPG